MKRKRSKRDKDAERKAGEEAPEQTAGEAAARYGEGPATAEEDADTARAVKRFQAGHEDEAFSLIYTRYLDRVLNYLQVVLRHYHDAEDGAQQVFIHVLKALPRYEERGRPFRAWLFTIARNYALGELRRAGHSEILDPDPHSLLDDPTTGEEEPSVISWITDPELLMFFERLPLAQRQVLLLHYLMGLSIDQTAEILGRNREAVRKLQSRALKVLRERLRAIGRGPEGGGPEKTKTTRYHRQARVVRARKFALTHPDNAR